MAGYTDTEINDAVARYVRSGLKIERSPLGPVDANSKFAEVLALVSSTLIYDPNAIFYLIYLSSNRLNANVLTAIGYLDDLYQAITEMGKHTEDVTRVTLLGDAAAALLTVDQILTDKSALSSQAYSRYQASLDQFVTASLRPNIKTGTAIVRPPQLARRDALSDLGLIADAYAAILADTEQMMSMLSEFLGLNLPVLAIQESVRLVRYDLQQLQTYFESPAYTKNDRIAKCRAAYLEITAGRSVLDNYTSVTDPSSSRMIGGTTYVGRLVLPESGAVVPASVTGTKSGPWAIVSGVNDTLSIAEDGNAATVYVITAPVRPSLRCYGAESYTIITGYNDCMEIDGLFPTITLTGAPYPGAARTAAQIAADISAWITANYPGQYSATVLAEGGKNYVKVTKTLDGIQRLRMTADDVAAHDRIVQTYGTLGFYEGQQDDNAGVSASELAEVINSFGLVTASVERTVFEEGLSGSIASATVIDLPPNTLASTDHANDQILIRDGLNVGYHRIVSVTRYPTADEVLVDASTPFPSFVVTNPSWLILRERLVVTSKSSGMNSEIDVGVGNANTTIGLTVGSTDGQTTGFRASKSGLDVDFTQMNVEVGDYLYLTTSTTAEAKFTITEVVTQQLEFTPALPASSVITAFRIVSAAAEAYQALVVAVRAWNSAVAASEFETGTLELDRVMNPLLSNERPSLAQINDAKNAITSVTPPSYGIKVLLTQLSTALTAYVVLAVGRIDAALRMLRERGMDRAYDLLMKGEVAAFFNMDKDDAASSAFMLKSMRSLVQQDLPLSKLEDGVDDDMVRDTITQTDASLDYSDQDADENVRILGEVPDFDNPNDAASTSKVSY